MGQAISHLPVKLICGLIFKDTPTLEKTQNSLTQRFGKIDFSSRILDFTHTDYYDKEFGKNLKRKFLSFHKLIDPITLPEVKEFTNELERRLSINSLRQINIDPGYLNLSKLVLATTKDYVHRIYLNRNIYAEATLYYQNKTYCPWPWTYPDYRTPEYLEIFHQIRDIYEKQI